jgi:hypothetical protein
VAYLADPLTHSLSCSAVSCGAAFCSEQNCVAPTFLSAPKAELAPTRGQECPRYTLKAIYEALVSKLFNILHAMSITLLWSGTDPFGVNLSTSPGSNCAMALPATSGETPALAASSFT